MSSRQIWIGGERWRIRVCAVPKTIYGDCDYQKKTIRVSEKLHGEDRLNVILHELIHARWPDLSEDAVVEFADELAGIVYAHGFRHKDEDGE
jgi:hypothetical protein